MTVVAGTALLLLLFVDVLGTVFHPNGHGGPVHRAQNRILWWLLHHPARALGGDRLVSFCGPLILAASIVIWSLWLVVGFALLYRPWLGTFFRPMPGESNLWFDAIYFSGTVVSTLGIGDLVPTTPMLRILTAIEALSGFALFAVATTYVLALTQRVGAEQVLALEVSTRTFPSGPQEADPSNLSHELRSWSTVLAGRLVEIVQAHAQYPALHYFRPADPRRSLLVQICPVVDLALADRLRGPGLDPLRASLRLYLSELEHKCLPSGARTGRCDPAGKPVEDDLMSQQYHRLLHHLGYESPSRSPC